VQKLYQQTIVEKISFQGIGLHTGLISKVQLVPGAENTGVVFKRVDLTENNIIEANFKNVSSAILCTTLKNSFGAAVSTVEHLMAAFYITGVDNVVVEINNNEIPIMDGSSKDFVSLINKVGLKKMTAKRQFLKILKKVELKQGEKKISIKPAANCFDVEFQLDYKNKSIGNPKSYVSSSEQDLKAVYSSRTFCLFEDIEKIKKNGLAKGGSLDNAVVIKDKEVLNEGGLRNEKEFANHKILDLAGDFLLSGYRMLGSVKCVQGGHYLSNIFIKEVFKDKSNFALVNVDNIEVIKKDFKTSANKLAVNA